MYSFAPLLVLGREPFLHRKAGAPETRLIERLEVARANPPAPAGKKRQSLVAVADVIEQLHAGPFSVRIYQKQTTCRRLSKIESKEKTKQNKKQKKTAREEKKARTISKTSSACEESDRQPPKPSASRPVFFCRILLFLFWSKYYRERSTRHL